MHKEPWRNIADYIVCFSGTSILGLLILLFAVEDPDKYAWMPFAGGFVAAAAMAKRDDQYRRVESDVAATPGKFAQDVETSLDAGLAQLKELRATTEQLKETADELKAAIEKGCKVMAAEPAEATQQFPGVPVGRGFE